MMEEPNAARDIFLGRFVKPHGTRGELKLYASEDFWFEALDSEELFVAKTVGDDVVRRPVRVERAQPHQKQYIVKLEGVAADQLDEKLAALTAAETKGASADERRRKFVSKKVSKKVAARKAKAE